jgi:predicted regulator of Ras-like GTPase activity (Roadblock/LC7/MglB family)
MVKKKKSMLETSTTVVIDQETKAPAVEEGQVFTSLSAALAETNKCKGVIGYIMRNANSATIDLKDPTKLIKFAILSSQALDSGKEISELLNLGGIETIFIEGKDIKALCMVIGENNVTIFMEKDVDHADILARLRACNFLITHQDN